MMSSVLLKKKKEKGYAKKKTLDGKTGVGHADSGLLRNLWKTGGRYERGLVEKVRILGWEDRRKQRGVGLPWRRDARKRRKKFVGIFGHGAQKLGSSGKSGSVFPIHMRVRDSGKKSRRFRAFTYSHEQLKKRSSGMGKWWRTL